MRTTTRKGLPLPDSTDVYNVNYTVGPPGRTFPISGVVRDTDNAQSNILDGMTEYNQNEQITGSWEFTQSILADKGLSVMAVNNSGAARVSGDVVMLDPSNDTAFIIPNASGVDAGKVLIVAENIASLAVGRTTVMGIIRLKVQAGTTRGQYLQTVAGQVYAAGSANITPGSFGYSLTSPDGSSTVLALVHAGGAGGGLEVREVDAAPDIIGARVLQFPNGSVTDLGNQVVGITFLPTLEVLEADGTPDVTAVSKIQVPAGGLTNLGGGYVALKFLTGLEVKEVDGAPDVTGATVLQFPNGSLTDNGSGNVSITFGSSIIRTEAFNGVSGTTVTTSLPVDRILCVSKNGVEERSGVDYTAAGNTITWSNALVNDNISVIYIVTNSFNPSSAPYVQEFNPNASDTTVTLMGVPTTILGVFRGGVSQSTQLGDWVWNAGTAVITFSDAFIAGEHVQVVWSQNFGGGNASTVNNLPAVPSTAPAANSLVATDATGKLPVSIIPSSTDFQEEFLPPNGTTTVTLSQAPSMVWLVTRDGIVQSKLDGNYSVAGRVITFTDAFDGLSRVTVSYTMGTVIGGATTVGGFNASADNVATPGTLVATNPTTGKLPASVLPSLVNQLVNGGLEIWQRGSGPFTAAATRTADAWYCNTAGSDSFSISRDTSNVDLASQACMAFTFTNGTGAGGTRLGQILYWSGGGRETGPSFRGKVVSVSMRIKCSVPNAIRIAVNYDGTGGPGWLYGSYHSGGGAYETLTLTTGVIPTDATYFWAALQPQASGTFYIDNTVVVVGSTPADYTPLPPADDLARAKRYYTYQTYVWRWYATGAGALTWMAVALPVPMALAPTITYTAGTKQNVNGNPSPDGTYLDHLHITYTTNAAGDTYEQYAQFKCEANP